MERIALVLSIQGIQALHGYWLLLAWVYTGDIGVVVGRYVQ